VPFLIEGTTQNPKFLPAIGNELKQNLGSGLLQTLQGKQAGQNQTKPQQKQDLKGVLGGLLKKKSQ